MCTAISLHQYFGRTLDLEYHYNESVVITPRNFSFTSRNGKKINRHYAIIGIATVIGDYPLYYDAVNEKGLSAAGLNFPHNAHYFPVSDVRENVAPFELIPRMLSQFASVDEVRKNLAKINLADINFSEELRVTPLHWIFSDKKECITVECVVDGLKIYENPVGVLTNNPPFPLQTANCEKILSSLGKEENDLKMSSRGLDAFGLPGDLSSPSRFARVAFAKEKSPLYDTEEENVTQFFHILGCVNVPAGYIKPVDGKSYRTVYTSCCNTDTGVYYYTTYGNSQITAVSMHGENLEADTLIAYPLVTSLQINRIN